MRAMADTMPIQLESKFTAEQSSDGSGSIDILNSTPEDDSAAPHNSAATSRRRALEGQSGSDTDMQAAPPAFQLPPPIHAPPHEDIDMELIPDSPELAAAAEGRGTAAANPEGDSSEDEPLVSMWSQDMSASGQRSGSLEPPSQKQQSAQSGLQKTQGRKE